MAYIGGSGALILETQSSTGAWNNGLSQVTDPSLGTAIGLQDDLVPTADAAYDIGTKLKRIRTLHVSKANDDSAGETLEIGNYTADTGVTAVYGQLQGKGGTWKLASSGTSGSLQATNALLLSASNGVIKMIPSGTNKVEMNADAGLYVSNAAASQSFTLTPGTTNIVSTVGDLRLRTNAGATGTLYTQSDVLNLTANSVSETTAGTHQITSSQTTGYPLRVTGTSTNTNAARFDSDNGVTVVNAAGTRSLTLTPSTTQFVDATTDLYVRTGSNNTGGFLTNNLYLGPNNNNASFTYIGQNPANSAAQTSTITLGAGFAGSTNTINIGKIAANDITTITGSLVRQPEFISLYLASNATLAAGTNVTNAWPSMSTLSTQNLRYLSWDDTNHRFSNSHPTLALTVMINISVEWGSSTGGRGIWVNWGAGPSRVGAVWWVAGAGGFSGSSCIVTLAAAGGVAAPVIFANSGSEIMNGSASANTNRTTIQACVL